MSENHVPAAVTVSVSDADGVAGILADIKTFGAFAVHGAAVVTAVRAGIADDGPHERPLPAGTVRAQLENALKLLDPPAVKVGFLPSAEAVRAVVEQLKNGGARQVVVHPSANAESSGETVSVLKSELLPLAEIVVANTAQASSLAGVPVRNSLSLRAAAKLIHRMGTRRVLITGTALPGEDCVDILFDGEQYWDFPSERIEIQHSTGAGDALSAAIAAGLAHGREIEEAVAIAKAFVTEAIRNGYRLMGAVGTVNQLHAWWAGGGSSGYGG